MKQNNRNRKKTNSPFRRSRRQIVTVIMTVFLLVFVITLTMIYILSYQDLYQENQEMLETYIDQYQENGNPGENQIAVDSSEPDETLDLDGTSKRDDSSEADGTSDLDDTSESDGSSDLDDLPDPDNTSKPDDLLDPDDTSDPDDLPDPDDTSDPDDLPDPDNLPDHDSTRYLLSSFYSVAFDEDGNASSVDLGDGTLYTESQLTEVAESLLENGKNQGTHGRFIYSIETSDSGTLVVLMDNTLTSDSFTTLFRYALLLGTIMVVVLLLCATGLARWIIRPLEESDRRQRQFISDAGHELKTPVSVVEANAELLEREIGENKWLQNIRSEGSRMAGLVNELLDLARTERETYPMEDLDLSRLVLGGVLPFESVAFESGRELDYQLDEDITIHGNPQLLSQLVSILMDNALSHCSGEGDIAVRLQQEKSETILTVSNPGFIPEQDRSEIFSRFFRSDANRGDTGHYGLGLTIAQNIVTVHQGVIDVDCVEERVVFSVRLPASDKKKRKP
ncbi:MAG: HAMP domain-containing histidine kinase [Lachnospiraceae bacterium]|nr:HAMP domain-containing histidine kinase [Lachnospiraceae bacterium]